MSKFTSDGPEPRQELLVEHVFGSNKKRRAVREAIRTCLAEAHADRGYAGAIKVSAAQFLLAQALRGRDWTTGFQVATNSVKVANGKAKGSGMAMAIRDINFMLKREDTSELLLEVFDGFVTREQEKNVMKLLPSAQVVKQLSGKNVEPFRVKSQVPKPKILSVRPKQKVVIQSTLEP